MRTILKSTTAIAAAAMMCGTAYGADFNIPAGDLSSVLAAYTKQTGVTMFYAADEMRGKRSRGIVGNIPAEEALSRILSGTGFGVRHEGGGVEIIRERSQSSTLEIASIQIAQAAPSRAAVETVTVTSSKLGGADVQSIPIAITALSQEQLTATQTAGGPDLVKQVPNLTFTKTNFSGYSIQIRGIGTQAISVTTDPAVAVAFNDVPFIRNHFFEQEFYDLSQAEVLRGPQGTLYGRNATAGVVNLISAKPTDQFEAMASADVGNYKNRRFEAMINLPIVDDRLDLRVAGEWTKRDGYTTNELTHSPIDGRDLWSGRATIAWKPLSNLQTTLVWEHFQENDDRLRSSKQLCKTDPTPTQIAGVPVVPGGPPLAYNAEPYLSQGCRPVGLYDKGNATIGDHGAFGVPNGVTLPYYEPLAFNGVPVRASGLFDPYATTTQSTNLREIESTIDPHYRAKNDTVEANADYVVLPSLTLTSQTAYSQDFLWSTEDYNRFNTRPGAFVVDPSSLHTTTEESGVGVINSEANIGEPCSTPGVGACDSVGRFCDPQLGCSDRLVAEDLNDEHSWQFSQELRLASSFSGPLNFSVGGNYLHYETEENYYVFINSLTLASYSSLHNSVTNTDANQTLPWVPGVSDNSNCLSGGLNPPNPNLPSHLGVEGQLPCGYIDPNPIASLNNEGHNYFLSQNPYTLNSYAGFGETYYSLLSDLKLTGGIRWTDDQKHFVDVPSQLLTGGYGYPVTGIVDQEWNEFTGRFAANWSPKLNFTDQTLFYASFAHGYKAGGANPPGAQLLQFGPTGISTPTHPLTFKPEFVNAYEVGTKNSLLDGAVTFNGSLFFYDYKGYQISRIVDRTAINDNFDAIVNGAEVEASYEPAPGLRFKFAGGYEHTRIDDGQASIDLMDRADIAHHPDWMVVKPFVTQASNCILPVYVVAALLKAYPPGQANGTSSIPGACSNAYQYDLDPVTQNPYKLDPIYPTDYNITGLNFNDPGPYPGFDPQQPGINHGEGFAKDLGGNELPNAPPFTVSFSGDYTLPLTPDWAGTFHVDYYWQDYSWARVFNDNPYDRLRGYTNVNLALILTSQSGWQVMGYLKNVFDTTAITGDFLNSDDSGLTTNVFLTDPRLFGVRVTKNW
ncbi:MAG TPA: TonB-dependent receptor plug domain-containing protein [Rhizomicrobium sp.]|nr:TonB-dependent receptor plug domain-containing protein [Rhizomicrobium sp.]